MASFWDGISNIFGWFFGFEDSEDDYLPPPRGGKRKAREELRRASQAYKARRCATLRSYARPPAGYLEDSEYSEESDRPQYLARGALSGTDTELSDREDALYPTVFFRHRNSLERHRARAQCTPPRSSSRRDSAHGSSRLGSDPRRVSVERDRNQRVSSFEGIDNGIASVAKTVVSTITSAGPAEYEEADVTEADIQERLEREEKDSDKGLSEDEWGRKYWSATPWEDQEDMELVFQKYSEKVSEEGPAEENFEDILPEQEEYKPHKVDSVLDSHTDLPVDEPSIELPTTDWEPVDFPIYLPVSEKITKPVSQMLVTQPITKPVAKPIKEPTSRPKPKPTPKPTSELFPVPEPQPDPRPHLEQWATDPSRRIKELKDTSPASYSQRILEEIQEPRYTLGDVEIRDMLWQIMDLTERLATEFFYGELTRRSSNELLTPAEVKADLRQMYELLDPATSLIIGCVASGGPRGADGWHELFVDPQKRRALVCGIIGNVLVEQVFKHPCFGAEDGTLELLKKAQEELKDDDGFARKHQFATILQPILFPMIGKRDISEALRTPRNFEEHTNAVVNALYKHLLPIFTLPQRNRKLRDMIFLGTPKVSTDQQRRVLRRYNILSQEEVKDDGHGEKMQANPGLVVELTRLVGTAGLLALHMAADPHAVYYHTPVFKEDRFDPAKHEAFNQRCMEQTHPRQPGTVWPLNTTEAEKRRAQGDEALNQILLMDGLTVYRKGGWEKHTSNPRFNNARNQWEGREFVNTGDHLKGFRVRVLTHGWVYCRWGRARRFGKDGQPADVAAEHGDLFRGFVEFRDVGGVPWTLGFPEPAPKKVKKMPEGVRRSCRDRAGAMGVEELVVEEPVRRTSKSRGKDPMVGREARYG